MKIPREAINVLRSTIMCGSGFLMILSAYTFSRLCYIYFKSKVISCCKLCGKIANFSHFLREIKFDVSLYQPSIASWLTFEISEAVREKYTSLITARTYKLPACQEIDRGRWGKCQFFGKSDHHSYTFLQRSPISNVKFGLLRDSHGLMPPSL